MTVEKLLQTMEQNKTLRSNWMEIWDEISYFVLPSKVGFNSSHMPGERHKWSRRFDTTAGQSNKTLANHLHMALCSPSQPWFELYYKDEELNKNDAAKEWAEDSTHRMFNAFNDSNFGGQVNTMFQTLCAFGTACFEADFISTPREPFSLVFYNIKLSECVFDIDMHRRVDTVFREYEYTQRQAQEKFGRKFEVPGDGKVSITRIVLPNDKYDPESLDPKKRKILVHWLFDKEIFKTESLYDFPYMTPRFDEIDDDVYGEGPALLALSDIRSLNRAKELEFRGYEKAIDPPLMGAAGGIIGDLHINAGGYTQVRDPRMIGEMPGKMDIQLTMIKGEELRDSIKKAYKIDELLVPERKGQNPATATEIQIRYEQMQKMMGATVGRIEAELLKPLINRVFGIMLRNGRFGQMPEEIAGGEMDIKYVGPLAKSQISNDAVAIERILQAEMAVGQIAPEALMVVDHLKAMRVLADRYNVPAEAIRSEKEVEAIQQAQQQQAQQQQMQEQQMQQAQGEQMQAEADSANVQLLQQIQGGGM